jgi:hypothetical protein
VCVWGGGVNCLHPRRRDKAPDYDDATTAELTGVKTYYTTSNAVQPQGLHVHK